MEVCQEAGTSCDHVIDTLPGVGTDVNNGHFCGILSRGRTFDHEVCPRVLCRALVHHDQSIKLNQEIDVTVHFLA